MCRRDKYRILLVCLGKTPYVLQICKYLCKYSENIEFSLFTDERCFDYYSESGLVNGHIYTYSFDRLYLDLIKRLVLLPHFDIIHTLWMAPQLGLYAQFLKCHSNKLFVSVGGSDLYRRSKKTRVRLFQKRLIRYADWLSSENEQTRKYFYEVYGKNITSVSHSILRFGVDILDHLNKQTNSDINAIKCKYNIVSDKIVVMCGYNGSIAHQHFEIISAIKLLPNDIVDKLFFIIPMTYGLPNENYMLQIKKEISAVTDNYVVLTDYLTTKEMAEVTMITDIMIHVQTTDQLSSTMIAHMYNGNIVVAGEWLPYDEIKNAGIHFWQIETIGELTDLLVVFSEKLEYYKKLCEENREKVYKFSSWEYQAKEWLKIYYGLMEDK